MNEDFFSILSKKCNGLDMAFALVGALWLIGTVIAFSSMGLSALATAIPTWGGFIALYWLVKKYQISSNWKTVLSLIVLLQIWKAVTVVTVSILLN